MYRIYLIILGYGGMVMARKSIVFVLVLAMLAAVLAGCGDAKTASGKGKLVGVTMPTKSLQRWNEDGANVKAALEAKGFRVDLQYADNKQDVQNSQIENQITMGCDVLVIASIDGGALGGVLQQAKEQNIPVIAYDRLITNTDKCDYYATFDNYGVGKMQGEFIVEALGLDKGETGPFYNGMLRRRPGRQQCRLVQQGRHGRSAAIHRQRSPCC